MDDREVKSKKDFDLEVVYHGFKNCMTEDGTVKLREYLDAFSELCRYGQVILRCDYKVRTHVYIHTHTYLIWVFTRYVQLYV